MATISEALAIAIQHQQAGRLQAAEQIYRQILAVVPNHADAIHLLGVIAHQAGRHEVAIEYIGRAIGLKGSVALFHNNLGGAYCALWRIPEAIACYRRALELQPDYADAHNNLGNALKDQRKLDEAVACYRRALELKPDMAEAHNNLGNALNDQRKPDEAAACCRRALELKPDLAVAHNNLGNALKDQGKPDEAVACYRRALELQPDLAQTHSNLGNALKDQGKLDEAVACYRRALKLKPDFAEVYNDLGMTLQRQGKLDEAVACYRRALELKPDVAETCNTLGLALQDQGRIADALACYQRAIELRPQFAEAHYNRSMLRLLAGDFEHGLADYEWRWQIGREPFIPPPFQQPLWDGRPLEGRRLLLHAEQGSGDTIQFIRYAAQAKQRGAQVVVGCPERLLRIVRSCRFIDEVVHEIAPALDFDVYCPLMSMPGLLKTTLESVPADVPYLFAAPDLVKQWRERLGAREGFKIGIAWRGNPRHRNDRDRSIPLSCFEPLAGLPGIRLFSLQKGAGTEELQDARDHFPVAELGSRLEDFMDTAAVLKNLDLVITCDTAVAHLAGALGVPVWVAIPFAPDWRWLLDRSDSPWYPTMRLFRQDRRGDWQGVFRRIEVALGERMSRHGVCPNDDS